MRVVSIANPVVSKNLNWNGEILQLWGWKVTGSPAADARPSTSGERDEIVPIPFAHESFWFETKRVFPIPCCVILVNHLTRPPDRGDSHDYNEVQ